MNYKILQRIFLIIFLMMTVYSVNAQYPPNYVPNPGFESGNGGREPDCANNKDNEWVNSPKDMHHYLQDWYTADNDVGGIVWAGSLTGVLCSPDWIGPTCIDGTVGLVSRCTFMHGSTAYATSRFVGMSYDGDPDYDEGIRVDLNWNLAGDKTYVLRMKMMDNGTNSNGGLRVHFTKWAKHWDSEKNDNTRFMDAANVGLSPDWGMGEDCKWYTVEKVFTVPSDKKDDLANMVLKVNSSSGNYTMVDDIELYEYCSSSIIRQKRDYSFYGEREEGRNIFAGANVDNNFPMGDVNMYNQSIVTYKANNEVLLMPGVNIERGANFTAKIAPCGRECPLLEVNGPESFNLCNGLGYMEIGYPKGYHQSYYWTADNSAHLAYLSSTNISNPIFTAPSNVVEGTIKYYLHISNSCGESKVIPVFVRFSRLTDSNPIFTLSNKNISNVDNPSFTINPGPNTETVIVEVLKCNGEILSSKTYRDGVDFTSTIAWNFNGIVNPCGCYQIRVKSKNYCFNNWHEELHTWTKPANFGNFFIPNVTICEDEKRLLCISATGTGSVHVDVKNRWGNNVHNETKSYESDPLCFELSSDLPTGTYYAIVKFTDCNGNIHEETTTITILNCFKSIIGTLPQNCIPFAAYMNIPVKLQSESGVFTDHQTFSNEYGEFTINLTDLAGQVDPHLLYRVAAIYSENNISYGEFATLEDLSTTLQITPCPPLVIYGNINGALNCAVVSIPIQLEDANGNTINYTIYSDANGQFSFDGPQFSPLIDPNIVYRVKASFPNGTTYTDYRDINQLVSGFTTLNCPPSEVGDGDPGDPGDIDPGGEGGSLRSSIKNNNDIKLYPNPANTLLNIYSKGYHLTKVLITDIIGKKIVDLSLSSSQINISDIPSGVYHIKLIDENSKVVHQQKLIIIHE
jgi:hypothetical protein